jgi:hypothetical protein
LSIRWTILRSREGALLAGELVKLSAIRTEMN